MIEMKPVFNVVILIFAVWTTPHSVIAAQAGSSVSQKVSTALEHLTVLEYEEPVAQAAIGSSAFQVERQDNKVFVKPLQENASTNLFVWTASGQQFSYELSVADLAGMTALIHVPSLKPTPPKQMENVQPDRSSAMAVTQTLLGVQAVEFTGKKPSKKGVYLRIDNVYRDQGSLFIRYSLENHSGKMYRATTPVLYQLQADHPEIDLVTLKNKQLDSRTLERLGGIKKFLLASSNDVQVADIPAGGANAGLIAVSQRNTTSPMVVQVVFAPNVTATMVL